MDECNLTPKQKRFCDEYLIDLNGTQAAIRAGYSEKTAKVIAAENLTKPDIKEYIEKRMKSKEKELIATQDEVLEYLSRVMRREEKESIVVTLSKKESKWVFNEETGKNQKQTIEEEVPQIVEIPSKLSDSNKAAELLGKRYGIYKENFDVNGAIPVVIVDDMDEEDE